MSNVIGFILFIVFVLPSCSTYLFKVDPHIDDNDHHTYAYVTEMHGYKYYLVKDSVQILEHDSPCYVITGVCVKLNSTGSKREERRATVKFNYETQKIYITSGYYFWDTSWGWYEDYKTPEEITRLLSLYDYEWRELERYLGGGYVSICRGLFEEALGIDFYKYQGVTLQN